MLEVALYHGDGPKMPVLSPVRLSVEHLRVRYVCVAPLPNSLEDCHSLTHESSCQKFGLVLAHDALLASGMSAEVEYLLLADQVMAARVGVFPAEAARPQGLPKYSRQGKVPREGRQ